MPKLLGIPVDRISHFAPTVGRGSFDFDVLFPRFQISEFTLQNTDREIWELQDHSDSMLIYFAFSYG